MVREAEIDIYKARLTLRQQRIFMPEDITNEFSEVIERMSEAQVEKRFSLENPHIPSRDFGSAPVSWLKDCTAVFERLAKASNSRLFRQERQLARDR
jgi:hypothetical protein